MNKCLLLELESGGAHGQMNTWVINFEIIKIIFFETFNKVAKFLKFSIILSMVEMVNVLWYSSIITAIFLSFHITLSFSNIFECFQM